MTKSEAASLQSGDVLIVTRSGKTYRVAYYDTTTGSIRATQLRNGQIHGASRLLMPGAVQRLSTADDRHPASRALTSILQPTTIRVAAPTLRAALTPAAAGAAAAALEQPPQFASPQTDASKERILTRRVVRAAERWQRKFPAPPSADEPELHALWVAVERLVAHDEGRPPHVSGEQGLLRPGE